ncbi:uncharacterized protein BDZ99DRAFT_25455 [Mytilinidion resinicola]|uniref:DUF7730 domain-containing protein n=1 Tax=Mytilinidion resinicola TaxID=574789 RepID=A0A6A6ZAZ3_9PEZI|nr:uncharacterized protein BDZ99DRAFT_25455 [Mytilinidion resinicola]KAF2818018.1 hypothetical protein BDZ99DRAFT_25455 [Mytilinidion resinicola]
MAPPAESKPSKRSRTAAIPRVVSWIRRVKRGRRQAQATKDASRASIREENRQPQPQCHERQPLDQSIATATGVEGSEHPLTLEEPPKDEPPSNKDLIDDAAWSLGLPYLAQRQDPSRSSFLARLPLELREMIYREVISGSVIHLYKLQDGLRAYDCYRPDGQKCRCGHVGAGPDSRIARRLSLPLTCRQIHHEAIPILYSTNTFVTLINKDIAPALIHLPRLLHPESFQGIRSLCIRWSTDGVSFATSEPEWPWSLVWETIASMKGLRHLRFHVDMWHPLPSSWRGWFRQEKGLLRIAEQHAEDMSLNSFHLNLPDPEGVADLPGEPVAQIKIGARVYPVKRVGPSGLFD